MQESSKEINTLRIELNSLKSKLNEINQEKEKWFNKKEELNKQISFYIQEIKKIKSTQDKSNINVQDLKKQRENYNKKYPQNYTQ